MGSKARFALASLALTGALLAARDADADASFFINASTGPGFGVYHRFTGLGTDFGGFSFHVQACMGVRFAKIFGIGAGGAFQPLIADGGFFPGGFGAACLVVAPIPRVHFDVHAGFGGVGATGAAYVGPAASAGAAYDLIEGDKVRVFVGLRVLAFPGWSAGQNGVYISPTLSIGARYW